MANIEIKEAGKERWGLYVNGILIGDSKARFDADHAKVMLEKALGEVTAETVRQVPTPDDVHKARPGLVQDFTANEMLDAVVASLKGYPNHGGDIGVMTEVDRIVQEDFATTLGRIKSWTENTGATIEEVLQNPNSDPKARQLAEAVKKLGDGRVRDVDEYLKMIATAGEDFPGQRNEARRQFLVEAAVGAAERIILRYADGSVEELNALTAQVAKEFFDKMVQSAHMALYRKELLNEAGKKTKEAGTSAPSV